MKYLDEFRDREKCLALAAAIRKTATRPWCIMEICGGQTHAIVKHGIAEMIGDLIELVHGPGCPVCVTPEYKIDLAVTLAARPQTVVFTYGDMLRVPGSRDSLQVARARGAAVRMLTNPLDAVQYARSHPEQEVVFFAIGFETTTSPNAMAVHLASSLNLKNFSVIASHVLVPPAMRMILSGAGNRVQGFLAAGHVCTVAGFQEYHAVARDFSCPIVVTGFEPLDILLGLLECVRALESGSTRVINAYKRCVTEPGNSHAWAMVEEVFELSDHAWRGLGVVPASGLSLRSRYDNWNAEVKFRDLLSFAAVCGRTGREQCIAPDILLGKRVPRDCPAFGKSCTPDSPLGAPMVSSEGACAAYYRYGGSPA